jgi:hypothetical protein
MDLITTSELAAAMLKAEQAALAAGTSLPTGASQSARLWAATNTSRRRAAAPRRREWER